MVFLSYITLRKNLFRKDSRYFKQRGYASTSFMKSPASGTEDKRELNSQQDAK